MKWTKDNVKTFWERYGMNHEFHGDIVSKYIVKLSNKYIGEDVLDIGAGTGTLIKLIPGSIGVDIVEKPGIIKADITNLPFDDGSFDTVFCTEVLEHLEDKDLKKGVQEVFRVLKPGGFFIVTTPFDENLEERMVVCPECGTRFHRVQHMQSFNYDSLKKVLSKFKIIKMTRQFYDFKKKIGRFTVRYKHVWFLRPLLCLFKKGNFYVVAKKV